MRPLPPTSRRARAATIAPRILALVITTSLVLTGCAGVSPANVARFDQTLPSPTASGAELPPLDVTQHGEDIAPEWAMSVTDFAAPDAAEDAAEKAAFRSPRQVDLAAPELIEAVGVWVARVARGTANYLVGIDPLSGERVWVHPYATDTFWGCSPALDANDRLACLVSDASGRRSILLIDPQRGTVVDEVPVSLAARGVLAADGDFIVVAAGAAGTLTAQRLTPAGSVVWTSSSKAWPVVADPARRGMGLSANDGFMLVTYGDNELALAVSLDTGTLPHNPGTSGESGPGRYVLAGRSSLAVDVSGVDADADWRLLAATGRQLAEVPHESVSGCGRGLSARTSPPMLAFDRRGVVGYNPDTGAERWHIQAELVSAIALTPDVLLVEERRGSLVAVDAATGEALWTRAESDIPEYPVAQAVGDNFVLREGHSWTVRSLDSGAAWMSLAAEDPAGYDLVTGTTVLGVVSSDGLYGYGW